MVTTPFDMVLNQESEKIRRYGSVGVGINETVTRYQRGFPLTVSMLGPVRTLRAALAQIREEYYPRRASELGININRINTEAFIDRFILEAQNCDFRYIYDTELIKLYENVVFEGAQGLRLDECSPEFPHVTRSRTGSTNIVTLCKEAGISEIELHYVTRCYRTRHGNGPLEGELPSHPFNWVGEETNQDHEYQGKFRYAKLDPCMLVEDIFWDVMNWRRNSLRSIPKIAVTCLDQMPAEDSALLLKKIEGKGMAYGIELGHTSIGPTRECVYELCEQDGRRSDRSLQTSGNSSSHCS
jgi:adenylosuccinate synthase